jgi:predicted transcriptional regulator
MKDTERSLNPSTAEDVVILQPGDERAQKVAKAISSQTANDVIQVLRKKAMTSTEIAGLMSIPITTATYHIENLLEAGILQVVQTKWSKKGREVKVYGLTNQVLIIAPLKSDVRSLLLKYMALFSIVVAASIVMTVLLPAIGPMFPNDQGSMPTFAPLAGVGEEKDTRMATYDGQGQSVSSSVHELVMYFFFGACTVIFLLMIYELYYWWRTSPKREKPPRTNGRTGMD